MCDRERARKINNQNDQTDNTTHTTAIVIRINSKHNDYHGNHNSNITIIITTYLDIAHINY